MRQISYFMRRFTILVMVNVLFIVLGCLLIFKSILLHHHFACKVQIMIYIRCYDSRVDVDAGEIFLFVYYRSIWTLFIRLNFRSHLRGFGRECQFDTRQSLVQFHIL